MNLGQLFLQGAPQGGGSLLYTILGIVLLVLVILVIVNVWRSRKAFIPKVLWTLIIVFVPVVGLILYFLLGREK
jgi:hypothetical protein